MLVPTDSGLCLWLRRVACACGYGDCLVLVASESGLCLWLSCQHVRVVVVFVNSHPPDGLWSVTSTSA